MKSVKIMGLLLLGSLSVSAQDIKESELPEGLKSEFAREYPNASGLEWEKEDGVFIAEFDQDNKEYELRYAADGSLIRKEVELKGTDLPAGIVSVLKASYASYEVQDVELTEEDGKTVYEVELEDGQQELQLLLDANGTVLQEQKD